MTQTGRDQPSSRAVAVVVAVGNLVVCGGLAAVLYVAQDGGAPASASLPLEALAPDATDESPPAAWDHPTTTDTTTRTTDTTTTTTTRSSERSVPGGDYQQVSGPGGMTTVIPATWPTRTATGPGAMQADDPANTARVLRYGGSPTTVTDSYALHAEYEREFSANKANYVSIQLTSTTVRGMAAIDWEFEYDADTGRRHVRSVYWLANGHEYFVYAAAPVEFWPDTQPILDVMLDHATP